MKRASKSELAQRINYAFSLLEQQVAPQQIIQNLQNRSGGNPP